MKNIAVIAGGDSGEYVISVKSGAIVAQNIPKEKYRVFDRNKIKRLVLS